MTVSKQISMITNLDSGLNSVYWWVFCKSPLGKRVEISLSMGEITLKSRSLPGAAEYASQRACRNISATNETELKGREHDKGRFILKGLILQRNMDVVTSVHWDWALQSILWLLRGIAWQPSCSDAVLIGQGCCPQKLDSLPGVQQASN